jgi:hypothetical protein
MEEYANIPPAVNQIEVSQLAVFRDCQLMYSSTHGVKYGLCPYL